MRFHKLLQAQRWGRLLGAPVPDLIAVSAVTPHLACTSEKLIRDSGRGISHWDKEGDGGSMAGTFLGIPAWLQPGSFSGQAVLSTDLSCR